MGNGTFFDTTSPQKLILQKFTFYLLIGINLKLSLLMGRCTTYISSIHKMYDVRKVHTQFIGTLRIGTLI